MQLYPSLSPLAWHPNTLSYLLNDEFLTNVAAGFASPRVSEPGPGNLVRYNDTNSLVSIDSGDLVISGTAAVANTDPAYYFTDQAAGSFARSAGLTLLYRLMGSGFIRTGFTASTTLSSGSQTGFLVNGSALQYMRTGNFNITIGPWSSLSSYLLAVTLRSDGIELRAKGGAFTDWKTLFVETANWTSSPLWPSISISGGVTARIGKVRILRPENSGKLATGSRIIGVSNPDTTILPAAANNVILLQGITPTGAANRKLELRYRQSDANNYMISRVEWNGSAYQYVTGHVIAGVETLQGTPVSGLVTAGNVFRMEVQVSSDTHRYYTSPGTNWTKQYADISDNSGLSNLGISVNNDGFTSTVLTAWDYDDTEIAAILNRASL